MKRLCVIGNSQVGSLKAGYGVLNNSSYIASFWSIPGGGGPNIKIKNNKILAASGFSDRVRTDIQLLSDRELDISRFDAVLLSGIGIPAIRKQNNTINSKYLAAEFIENEMLIDRQVLSKAVFSEIINNALQNLNSFKNITKIESIFKKKIYIQMFPMPTPDVEDQTDFDLQHYGRNLGGFLSWYYEQQSLIIKGHIRYKNISLVKYPSNWIESGFTPIEYASQKDAWHMNKDLGKYFMGHLMSERLLNDTL
jgi:hypothetical protein